MVGDVPVLSALLPNADADTLRQMTDRFRQRYPSGVVVVGSVVEGRPTIIAAVTDDLVKRGLHAGELVKAVAQVVGGSAGGVRTWPRRAARTARSCPRRWGRSSGWCGRRTTKEEL
jgi:alanyl-tRNA synthetase